MHFTGRMQDPASGSGNASTLFRSLMAQWVKNLPAIQETQETWVPSLGQEDPLEEEMATHSSSLAWEVPWTEKHCRLQSMGLQSQIGLSEHTLTPTS